MQMLLGFLEVDDFFEDLSLYFGYFQSTIFPCVKTGKLYMNRILLIRHVASNSVLTNRHGEHCIEYLCILL